MNDTNNGGDFEIRLLASRWRMLVEHWDLPEYVRIDLLQTVEDFHSDPLPHLGVYSETRLRLLLEVGHLIEALYPSQTALRTWLWTRRDGGASPLEELAGSLSELRRFRHALMLRVQR